MHKISAVIITFNEEKYIGQCIRSANEVADEIVVVDSYSTDRTKEICISLGVRFIEHPFTGYRDQKNFALDQAKYDYVLALDADEALSPELVKSIHAVKPDFKFDGYKFGRLNKYCGKWIYHTNLSPDCKIRLFNKNKGKWGGLNIHETVFLDNPKSEAFLKGKLHHWISDSYEEAIDKMNRYTTLLANEYFKQNIKSNTKKLLINPLWRFIHSYIIKAGFLDGYAGYAISKILSTTCFLKYIKLKRLCSEAKISEISKGQHKIAFDKENSGSEKGKLRPVSIGYDAKRIFYNFSGLGNYSRNLLAALSKRFPENTYYLFTAKTKNRYLMDNEGQFSIVEPTRAIYKRIGSVWRGLFMTSDIKRLKPDIFHGLSQELPVGIQKTGVCTIITVHDLIFMRYPEFYSKIDAKIYYWKLKYACRVADKIVAISEQTKRDIVNFLNVSPDKVSVIHQGCNSYFWNSFSKESEEETKTKYTLPERYLLYVGTIEERKNLLGLIKGMNIAKVPIPLIVIGRKTDTYYKKVLNYIASNNMNNVVFLEGILSTELPVIYNNAECFIYPSFFEGFGIPILEALVCGTPVIAGKGGCFAEAGGPGSIYVDQYNSEMIGEAILQVINNKELRDKMIIAGKEFSNNFREEYIAEAYMQLYYSLLKES